MKRHARLRDLGPALVLTLGVLGFVVPSSASPALREYEPVVVEGVRLTTWVGTKDLTRIGLFRYSAATGALTPIPFQIDKRRKIFINRNIPLGPPSSLVDVCEYGYFREQRVVPGSADDRFASNQLGLNDELVFLWKDAGDQAPTSVWRTDAGIEDERYEITMTDTNNGGSRWVYAFVGTDAAPEASPTKYVRWTSDAQSETCVNGLDSCGTAEGIQSAMPASIPVQRVHFLKNWVVDDYAVQAASSFLPSLVSRFEFRSGPESEDSWSGIGVPVFAGVYTGERPVRIVRQVQGAQSGTHTTRYDFIYPSRFVTRVNLRVHPLPDLVGRIRHDPGVASQNPAARVWTSTGFAKTSPQSRDAIDGLGPAAEQIDANQATYADWTEVATPARGAYAHFFTEARGLDATDKSYTYRDDSTDAAFGVHGRRLLGVGITQDGAFPTDYTPCPGCQLNDGGCLTTDPESDTLNYARIEIAMVPLASTTDPASASQVEAEEAFANAVRPITFATRLQDRDAGRPPEPPCLPSFTVAKPSDDGRVHLEIDGRTCASGSGYRIFRAAGGGEFQLLRDLGTQVVFRDRNVRVGETYAYKVRAYNEANVEGPDSATRFVTAVDRLAPSAPFDLAMSAGDRRLTLTWKGGTDPDFLGWNVWMSTDGGRAWEKQTAEPIPAWSEARWSRNDLKNGRTYCLRVESVDLRGNQSAPTAPLCGVPRSAPARPAPAASTAAPATPYLGASLAAE